MRRGIHVLLFLAMLFGMSAATVAAQDNTPGTTDGGASLLADLGYPELALTTDGETLDVPSELEAGRYHLTLTSDAMVDLELFQLPEGVTTDDLLAAFESGGEMLPDFFYDMDSAGGVSTDPQRATRPSSTWAPASGSSTCTPTARATESTSPRP